LKNYKLKILRIIPTLNPKEGGTSFGVINTSLSLIKKKIKVDILTSDESSGSFFKNKKLRIFNCGPGLGNYSFNLKLLFWLLKNKKNYNFFFIEGLWTFNSLIARFFLKKYYVFSHGHIDPYFSKQFLKKIKKQIYWFLFEKKNLIASEGLLCTTLNEKKLLNKTFVDTKKIKKKVIGYGINTPKFNKQKSIKKFYKKFHFLKNKKFYIFLGRFHEKKGCEIILETIKKNCKGKTPLVLMVGPDNTYKKKIILKTKKLKLNKNIFFSDILLNEEKWGALSSAKAMLLPSYGENFGISVVESLACSTPVLTTNKVNIYNDIIKFNCGLISNSNTNSFAKIFSTFEKFNTNKIKKLSKNSKFCFEKNYNLESKNSDFIRFFNNLKNMVNENLK